jgi:hypothetical protein
MIPFPQPTTFHLQHQPTPNCPNMAQSPTLEHKPRLYADLPLNVAAIWVSKLKPHSYRYFHSVVAVEPCLKIPSSYLVCENDKPIPVYVQDGVTAYSKEKSEGKAFDHVERCTSDHSPFLSMPGATVEFLERAVGRALKVGEVQVPSDPL